jgi:hypothetical protein
VLLRAQKLIPGFHKTRISGLAERLLVSKGLCSKKLVKFRKENLKIYNNNINKYNNNTDNSM